MPGMTFHSAKSEFESYSNFFVRHPNSIDGLVLSRKTRQILKVSERFSNFETIKFVEERAFENRISDIVNPIEKGLALDDRLWVDKYAPEKFTDLISDDVERKCVLFDKFFMIL